MKKTKVKMNKPVCLGQAILDISKTLMCEFWYDYLKPKYGEKSKLCYMDTDSFIIHIETEEFYKDIANGVSKWFDTSNYDNNDERHLPIGINKKVFGMFKDELGGKIMIEFCGPRAKTYSYLIDCYDDDDDDDDYVKNRIITKKAKGKNKFTIKSRIKFKDYHDSIFDKKTY